MFKSIQDSIIRDLCEGSLRYIDYQPGDCTRYELLFTEISDPGIIRAMGYGGHERLVLMQWLNGLRTSMVVGYQRGELPWQEVQSKLNVNEATAAALVRIIGYVSKREYTQPEPGGETQPEPVGTNRERRQQQFKELYAPTAQGIAAELRSKEKGIEGAANSTGKCSAETKSNDRRGVRTLPENHLHADDYLPHSFVEVISLDLETFDLDTRVCEPSWQEASAAFTQASARLNDIVDKFLWGSEDSDEALEKEFVQCRQTYQVAAEAYTAACGWKPNGD